MNLRTLCFSIWKSKYDRKGISSEYKPEFTRYIGVDDISEYPDILKTIYAKAESCPYAIFFDRSIPMQAEFEIIQYVGSELKTMDVRNLKSQDITLFADADLNNIFLESLDYAVNLALKHEKFFNESSRNDFILKLIVWTYSYIRPMSQHFEDSHSPKCFYYGDITRHEMYFLIMLYRMTFDVVIINPLRDAEWGDVDSDGLSTAVKSQQIMRIQPIAEIISTASEIDEEQSLTLQMQNEIDSTLFNGSGVYRAWQFRDGYTRAKFVRSTIFDLTNNYNEPARVRNGFRVDGKTVTIPNYFFQIDGIYSNVSEYAKLVNDCSTTPNTLVLTDRGESLLGSDVSKGERLKLVFCEMADGSYDITELKKLSFYNWDKYRDTLEDFMLNKINELIKDCMFKTKMDKDLKQDITCDILMMNEKIVKMVDGFDYTDKIPKLVIFLENEDYISDRILYLIGYIVTIGFDVVIFSPAGLISIDSVFETKRFNSERLDTMKYDCSYNEITKKAQKGFFGRLFGGK